MRNLILVAVISSFLCAPVCAGDFKADEPPKVNVSGRVVDPAGRPVPNAQLLLTDRDTGTTVEAKTDKRGHFVIKHDRTEFETLHVIAPPETKLAQATLTDIPAEDGRHVLVNLKPGVVISGKCMAEGKPLKNVTIRAIPRTKAGIHDGGQTTTNRKGEWSLTITPGEKIFEVTDVRVNAIVGLYRKKHLVTKDGALPVFDLPANQTAGVEK
jgi:hypothetical protein